MSKNGTKIAAYSPESPTSDATARDATSAYPHRSSASDTSVIGAPFMSTLVRRGDEALQVPRLVRERVVLQLRELSLGREHQVRHLANLRQPLRVGFPHLAAVFRRPQEPQHHGELAVVADARVEEVRDRLRDLARVLALPRPAKDHERVFESRPGPELRLDDVRVPERRRDADVERDGEQDVGLLPSHRAGREEAAAAGAGREPDAVLDPGALHEVFELRVLVDLGDGRRRGRHRAAGIAATTARKLFAEPTMLRSRERRRRRRERRRAMEGTRRRECAKATDDRRRDGARRHRCFVRQSALECARAARRGSRVRDSTPRSATRLRGPPRAEPGSRASIVVGDRADGDRRASPRTGSRSSPPGERRRAAIADDAKLN
eukprot:29120-Pelagococcus_subviridis.AAC.27